MDGPMSGLLRTADMEIRLVHVRLRAQLRTLSRQVGTVAREEYLWL